MNQKNNMRRIADYCISEGTAHLKDGRWKIPCIPKPYLPGCVNLLRRKPALCKDLRRSHEKQGRLFLLLWAQKTIRR